VINEEIHSRGNISIFMHRHFVIRFSFHTIPTSCVVSLHRSVLQIKRDTAHNARTENRILSHIQKCIFKIKVLRTANLLWLGSLYRNFDYLLIPLCRL